MNLLEKQNKCHNEWAGGDDHSWWYWGRKRKEKDRRKEKGRKKQCVLKKRCMSPIMDSSPLFKWDTLCSCSVWSQALFETIEIFPDYFPSTQPGNKNFLGPSCLCICTTYYYNQSTINNYSYYQRDQMGQQNSIKYMSCWINHIQLHSVGQQQVNHWRVFEIKKLPNFSFLNVNSSNPVLSQRRQHLLLVTWKKDMVWDKWRNDEKNIVVMRREILTAISYNNRRVHKIYWWKFYWGWKAAARGAFQIPSR